MTDHGNMYGAIYFYSHVWQQVSAHPWLRNLYAPVQDLIRPNIDKATTIFPPGRE